MESGLSPWPIWVNGRWYAADTAVFRADDAGLLYGHGAFETLRLIVGRPVALTRHLARLSAALGALQIELDLAPAAEAAQALAGRLAAGAEAAGRIVVTAGRPGGSPMCVVSARPVPLGVLRRRAGAAAVPVTGLVRSPAEHKTLAWLPSVLARQQAPAGVEPLFQTPDGQLLEGATSNLFVRRAAGWVTPPADRCLPGITRGLILEAARHLGQPVREAPVPAEWLTPGAEAFITNALLPLAPLTAFGTAPLRAPSALQRALRAGYDELAHAC